MITVRAFIITLGSNEETVLRRLRESGASVDDTVLILTPEPLPCNTDDVFKRLISSMRSYGLNEPELIKVPIDPSEGLLKLLDVIESCGCRELVIDVSSGPPFLSTYLLMALFLSGREATIYAGSCDESDIVIPPTVLGIVKARMSRQLYDLLSIVVNSPGITDAELSLRLGKKEKTIKVMVTELGKLGLIYRKGRAAGIYPSKWASVALRAFRSKLLLSEGVKGSK